MGCGVQGQKEDKRGVGWCWSVVYRVLCFGVTGVRRGGGGGAGKGKGEDGVGVQRGRESVVGGVEWSGGLCVVLNIYLTCIVLCIGYHDSHQKVAARASIVV